MATLQELEIEVSRIAQLVSPAGGTVERDTVVITTPIAYLDEYEVSTGESLLYSHGLSQTYFIADRAYEITSIREIHDFAQTSADGASLQVTKLTGTTVPNASDLNLITTIAYSGSGRTDRGFDLKGIAVNTVTNGTLTTQVSSLTLAAGDRLVWGMNGTIKTTFITLSTVLRKV